MALAMGLPTALPSALALMMEVMAAAAGQTTWLG